MKREEGYYWIRVGNEWSIAQFIDNEWWLVADDGGWSDKVFDEIDERRIERLPKHYVIVGCPTEETSLKVCSILAQRTITIADFTTKNLEKLKNP